MADVWGTALTAVVSGGVGGGVVSGWFRSQEWVRERSERRRDERRDVYLDFLRAMHDAIEADRDADRAAEEGFGDVAESAALVADEARARATHLADVVLLLGPHDVAEAARRFLEAFRRGTKPELRGHVFEDHRANFALLAAAALNDGTSPSQPRWRPHRRGPQDELSH